MFETYWNDLFQRNMTRKGWYAVKPTNQPASQPTGARAIPFGRIAGDKIFLLDSLCCTYSIPYIISSLDLLMQHMRMVFWIMWCHVFQLYNQCTLPHCTSCTVSETYKFTVFPWQPNFSDVNPMMNLWTYWSS